MEQYLMALMVISNQFVAHSKKRSLVHDLVTSAEFCRFCNLSIFETVLLTVLILA